MNIFPINNDHYTHLLSFSPCKNYNQEFTRTEFDLCKKEEELFKNSMQSSTALALWESSGSAYDCALTKLDEETLCEDGLLVMDTRRKAFVTVDLIRFRNLTAEKSELVESLKFHIVLALWSFLPTFVPLLCLLMKNFGLSLTLQVKLALFLWFPDIRVGGGMLKMEEGEVVKWW